MTGTLFALPDLGEGLTESELVSWEIAEGDTVELNQVIAEVETAKALVQLPSPHAGRITRLLVEAGETVKVGQAIVEFDVDGETSEPDAEPPQQASSPPETHDDQEPTQEPPPADATAPERTSVLVGYGPLVDAGERPQRRRRRTDWAPEHPPVAATPPSAPRRDIAVPEQAESATRPASGVQRRMAEAMVQSAFTAPHASVNVTVDVEATMALREKLSTDRRLTFLALVAKACLFALRKHPEINGRWDDESASAVQLDEVNLGVAVATDRGLLVPNIRDAGSLSLTDLADALEHLTQHAREGTTTASQMTGGTFTITNVGVFDVDGGVAILPPGEGAILAVGAVRRRPWEHEGEIALRHVVTLTLSFDHRLLDGRQAAGFVAEVARLLRDPANAFTL